MITNSQPTTRIPLTQNALDEKKAELERLIQLRKEVVVRLSIAREMGDLSENGAYTAAKFELGSIGRQMRDIRYVLALAYVPPASTTNTASFGCSITLDNSGKKMTFMLVSQYESNPSEHKLSLESPIGQAVIGKKVGDTVEVVTPKGNISFVVENIS